MKLFELSNLRISADVNRYLVCWLNIIIYLEVNNVLSLFKLEESV